MAAVAAEPVEVRAANLRERVEADQARVVEIGQELDRLDGEIRVVMAEAVADDPTGDLRAVARTQIKKLTDRRDDLAKEREEIERLLPHRCEVLDRLENEVQSLGVEELQRRRAVLDARVRGSVALMAEQFTGMVATYTGEFVEALGDLQGFHAEVRSRGLERVEGLIGAPVGAVPTDVLRLVELLAAAAGIVQSNPSPELVEACGFDGGLAELVRKARLRLQFPVDMPVTSWDSAHGEAV